GRDITLGIRERYLWELLSPLANDPVYMQLPGQFRAELHDRFMAPIYPFAFAALTFAFLGAPRTTRQSRNFSISSAILAVFGLRHRGCGDLAIPRATTARKDDAVLHPDRGDDLLSGAFAAPGARGRARRGRVCLAVHRASAGKRGGARNPGNHRLQSDLRELTRALQTDGGGAVRLRSRRRHTGRVRLLDQSGEQRWSCRHQCRPQRTAGGAADRADRIPIRYRLSVQGANRSARGDTRGGTLAV